LAALFVSGSTAAVTTIENEPGLVQDLKEFVERLIPSGKKYHHDDRWGDDNGFSHLRASLFGPSLQVPIDNGRLLLGTWQQIVLVDFDNRPRTREIVVQIMGETE
jgi:secondary thiamine-phosphate synthase enzyme